VLRIHPVRVILPWTQTRRKRALKNHQYSDIKEVCMTSEQAARDEGKARFDEWLQEPAVQQGFKEMAQARNVSHRAQGDELFHDGKPREAIKEYRKDTRLEITTFALAATVESAYCHMGDAYLLLGELDNAIAAYTKALRVWQRYPYGENPIASLAAVYLQIGQVDEALRVCEENPEYVQDACVQPILAEARRLKAGGEPLPEPMPGGRMIKAPFRSGGKIPPVRAADL
jgi:tetratricopeptide (TPR) repeat protein